MIRGLYTAATGMLVQELKQDNITNNLANMNTPGYKKTELAVSSFPQVLLKRIDAIKGSAAGTTPVGPLNNGAMLDEQIIDWAEGNLEETGNSYDLAINGEGFFTIETAQGLRYTRNGSFRLDGQGYLVTAQGDYVLGLNGPILVQGSSFTVAADGSLTVDGVYVDHLLITGFPDKQGLQKMGHDLYSAPEGALPRALEPGETAVKQGFLEKPNLNLVNEMVNMLAALRTYEANQKVIQAHDELLAKSANEIGSLR
ncbi:flagellar basal-body rod protein FlgF [Zhaonella formicivorans]|uniref:flagellar basal-body rod protein FlgF n=1 Tax=Zhaonella formicivorans TaxID=2528593 RepID=UPI0010D13926|nr:flagellar basal-body rod protein FlgF [Zhaonella formicivorans]